jgi:hypothetical protein
MYLKTYNNWDMFLDKNPITTNIFNTGTKNLTHPKHNNPFWKDVLDAWSEFSQKISQI